MATVMPSNPRGPLSDRSILHTYWQSTHERGSGFNDKTGARIMAALGSYKPIEDSIFIACVGSDGRTEKGFASKLEVAIYHRGLEPEILGEIRQVLTCLKDEKFGQLVNPKNIEEKDLTKDVMSHSYGDNHKVSPGRVMDSYPLYGNPDLVYEAKRKLVEEWTGSDGKRLLRYLDTRRKVAKQIMIRGTEVVRGETITHTDFADGIAYYQNLDPDLNKVGQLRSFKFGPLRFVQISIERVMAVIARSMDRSTNLDMTTGLMLDMPRATVDKLGFLRDTKLLSLTPTQVEEIIDCYLAFLQLYHISEYQFRRGIFGVQFDAKEARERIQSLKEVLNGTLVRGDIAK